MATPTGHNPRARGGRATRRRRHWWVQRDVSQHRWRCDELPPHAQRELGMLVGVRTMLERAATALKTGAVKADEGFEPCDKAKTANLKDCIVAILFADGSGIKVQ